VIISITSSFAAILKASQVRRGTHLAYVGADTRGQQEAKAELVAAATVFTDEVAQPVTIGDAQHAVADTF
jgi:ornithine cyclodeaminase